MERIPRWGACIALLMMLAVVPATAEAKVTAGSVTASAERLNPNESRITGRVSVSQDCSESSSPSNCSWSVWLYAHDGGGPCQRGGYPLGSHRTYQGAGAQTFDFSESYALNRDKAAKLTICVEVLDFSPTVQVAAETAVDVPASANCQGVSVTTEPASPLVVPVAQTGILATFRTDKQRATPQYVWVTDTRTGDVVDVDVPATYTDGSFRGNMVGKKNYRWFAIPGSYTISAIGGSYGERAPDGSDVLCSMAGAYWPSQIPVTVTAPAPASTAPPPVRTAPRSNIRLTLASAQASIRSYVRRRLGGKATKLTCSRDDASSITCRVRYRKSGRTRRTTLFASRESGRTVVRRF